MSYYHSALRSLHSSNFISHSFQFHFHLCLRLFDFVIIFLNCKIKLSVTILQYCCSDISELTLYTFWCMNCILNTVSTNKNIILISKVIIPVVMQIHRQPKSLVLPTFHLVFFLFLRFELSFQIGISDGRLPITWYRSRYCTVSKKCFDYF